MPSKVSMSSLMWSGEKPIHCTTTSYRPWAATSVLMAARKASVSCTSTTIVEAPVGTSAFADVPLVTSVRSWPRSTKRGETAEEMSPVPPIKSTRIKASRKMIARRPPSRVLKSAPSV